MEWQIVIAVLIAIPVILFPIAAIWYSNVGGIFTVFKEAKARRALREKESDEATD
jgi:hypothetical protein